jgi:hypothetical protein
VILGEVNYFNQPKALLDPIEPQPDTILGKHDTNRLGYGLIGGV